MTDVTNASVTGVVTSTPSLLPENTTENLTTTTLWTHVPREEAVREFWIGFFLAVTSACFTGSSFILKKKGLLNVTNRQGARAGKFDQILLHESKKKI